MAVAVNGDAVEMDDLANLGTVVNPVGAKAWTEPFGVDTKRAAPSSSSIGNGDMVRTERLCRRDRVPNPCLGVCCCFIIVMMSDGGLSRDKK